MSRILLCITLTCSLAILPAACRKEEPPKREVPEPAATSGEGSGSQTHTHADGTTHEGPADPEVAEENHDHAHDEVPLGTISIGELAVELAQGHGHVEAGKEGHLVVKLPYNDKGETIVRAWIGTSDRTMSQVGKGEYAPSHDDYDVHAVAPDPLPEGTMWWVEIQKPDGTKLVGSAQPITE